MYRVFALLINLIVSLTLNNVFQSEVTINIDVPNEVVAGTEFEVHVNVKKGDMESFSRLQQTFPAGLTASSYLSSNADFSFESKRVRMIWLRLPTQEEFTVAYKIKVDERLKGTFDIKGMFSYIAENERKSVTIESQPITILPSPTTDPLLIVDINDFEQQVIPYIAPASAGPQIACIRQQPALLPSGEGYTVTLLVNKEEKQKFAKIEEIIPAGFKAVSIDPKEAIFTFKNGTAKFLWMNLPSDPYFIVSYKLLPLNAKEEAQPKMQGKFSYLEEDKTISIEIKQTDRDLASLSAPEISELITALSLAPVAVLAEGIPPVTDKPIKVGRRVKKAKSQQVLADASAKTEKAKIKSKQKLSRKNKAFLLEPENGVYYRVQIAAGHKQVEIDSYFKKFNLDKEVRIEMHDGWQKYSIGSFPIYKEARDYRVHIWNTTAIADAFVSAYNEGARITVQEALMIANQEWYK